MNKHILVAAAEYLLNNDIHAHLELDKEGNIKITEDKGLTKKARAQAQELLDAFLKGDDIAKAQRKAEYPDPTELIIALWKAQVENDHAELEALQNKRLEIKAKYPKAATVNADSNPS